MSRTVPCNPITSEREQADTPTHMHGPHDCLLVRIFYETPAVCLGPTRESWPARGALAHS